MIDRLERALPTEPVERGELARVLAQVLTVEIELFKGPIPPPKMLNEYNEVEPGLAARIVERAEREQLHRHEMDRQQVADIRAVTRYTGLSRLLGQVFAFVIAMTAISIGGFLIYSGKDTEGLVSIIGTIVAIVAVFIGGKVADAIQHKSDDE